MPQSKDGLSANPDADLKACLLAMNLRIRFQERIAASTVRDSISVVAFLITRPNSGMTKISRNSDLNSSSKMDCKFNGGLRGCVRSSFFDVCGL